MKYKKKKILHISITFGLKVVVACGLKVNALKTIINFQVSKFFS